MPQMPSLPKLSFSVICGGNYFPVLFQFIFYENNNSFPEVLLFAEEYLLSNVALIYILRISIFLSQKCWFLAEKETWPAARGIRQANGIRQMTKLPL